MLNVPPDRSCRKAARLISEAQDHPLAWRDRIALRVHLSICDACARYLGQVRFMRRAIGRWTSYSGDP